MPATPSALVLIADGSEEIEAVTVIDILRRAEVQVTVASVTGRQITASRQLKIVADCELADLDDQPTYDLLVLPGGAEGARCFTESDAVQDLLRAQHEAGRGVAAICAAPAALARAGLLQGRRATSYPSFLEPTDAGELLEDAVVVDGHITTSRGPGTAMAFALSLVEQLRGAETRTQVAAKALAAG